VKRGTLPAFFPSLWAQKSARADRIGLPASHALAVQWVIQMFAGTNARPRDEIEMTALNEK
jgi:hypothetical protein